MTRLHVVGVPHAAVSPHDGHAEMVRKFTAMLTARGHDVCLYADDASDTRWFGGYSPSTEFANFPGAWDPQAIWWQAMNARAAGQVAERRRPGDLLALIGGGAQQSIAQALPDMRCIEYAIGYVGAFADFRCYASNAWRHYIQGKQGLTHGRFYDTVIPHFFDPGDFHLAPKEDFLLYLGRVNANKGIEIAVDTARRTGRRLVVAGPGDPSLCPDAEHLGVVTVAQRADLLARAHAVLMPSLYLEPFGNVAVEAMLSGTPAITTDWGAFPEIVDHGVTGYRCNTLADFCAAVDRAGDLDPAAVRSHAVSRFSADAVAPQYEAWFGRLAELDGAGWYTERVEAVSRNSTIG